MLLYVPSVTFKGVFSDSSPPGAAAVLTSNLNLRRVSEHHSVTQLAGKSECAT